MTNKTLVAMPMKAFDQAKSRLAEVMTDDRRERLARSLFLRTQRFFASNFAGFDRLVVTPSRRVCDECSRVGAQALLEPGVEGLNAASQRAIRWATEQGYANILLIPGDVPVWIRSEVRQLLEHARSHDVVIAQARDGGTNALLVRLPTDLRVAYGVNSSNVHLQNAVANRLSAIICKQPFLAHDLDVPADCAILASRRPGRLLERS